MPDGPDLALRLTHVLARSRREGPLALRLCHAVVDVAGARDCVICLGTSPRDRSVLCATSRTMTRFEEAQELLQEGPSIDVHSTGLAVRDAAVQVVGGRWPALRDATADLDLAGRVHALPMRTGRDVLGVLTVHHDPFSVPLSVSPAGLQFLADAVGAAILNELPDAFDESDTATSGLPDGVLWSQRDQVAQATGMVVAQLGLDPGDALAVLRAHAFAQSATLVEIARRVVGRELDFLGREPR